MPRSGGRTPHRRARRAARRPRPRRRRSRRRRARRAGRAAARSPRRTASRRSARSTTDGPAPRGPASGGRAPRRRAVRDVGRTARWSSSASGVAARSSSGGHRSRRARVLRSGVGVGSRGASAAPRRTPGRSADRRRARGTRLCPMLRPMRRVGRVDVDDVDASIGASASYASPWSRPDGVASIGAVGVLQRRPAVVARRGTRCDSPRRRPRVLSASVRSEMRGRCRAARPRRRASQARRCSKKPSGTPTFKTTAAFQRRVQRFQRLRLRRRASGSRGRSCRCTPGRRRSRRRRAPRPGCRCCRGPARCVAGHAVVGQRGMPDDLAQHVRLREPLGTDRVAGFGAAATGWPRGTERQRDERSGIDCGGGGERGGASGASRHLNRDAARKSVDRPLRTHGAPRRSDRSSLRRHCYASPFDFRPAAVAARFAYATAGASRIPKDPR